eukprot:TRINITY_DN24357_c0_g1_i1.p1 TRINITY_DN24357_c0_g1~~TRINITY_DN24357_c0_g1_i1.p1  ORF type:complete len:358 (+),score=59.47 TRINITY_DN24357_c0_g1_i1:50-1123(+)
MASHHFPSILADFPQALSRGDVKRFLQLFGYNATEKAEWAPGVGPSVKAWFPTLTMDWCGSQVKDLHTYYVLECSVVIHGNAYVKWRTARRMSEIKNILYARLLKAAEEDKIAGGTGGFLGLPIIGSTEKLLQIWLHHVVDAVNTGQYSPFMVAILLQFLGEKRVDVPLMPYLRQYGFHAINSTQWWNSPPDADEEWPFQDIRMEVDGHDEQDGHTQYHIRVSLTPPETGKDACAPMLEWVADRRLKQIREDWYDRMSGSWPQHKEFMDEPFAARGGLPGTTAKLDGWMKGIARCINCKQAPPLFVAEMLVFLDAPIVSEAAGTIALFGRPLSWTLKDPVLDANREQREDDRSGIAN